MAILDRENAFSQSQALTGTSLVPSTDVIDLSVVRQVGGGNGEPIIQVNFEVAAGGTTPTMTLALQTDDNASFSSATTVITYLSAVADAAFGASTQYQFPLPRTGLERYVRIAYTMGGTSPTSTVSAHLVVDSQEDVKYPGGFTVV
jgi:hypothetical protein